MIKKYSISELIFEIKHLLEAEYPDLLIEGEVTNLTRSSAGHWYFSLSDENSMISCAVFKMDALRNPILKTLKDGDKIILSGPISVYNKRGTFQIIGKRVLKSGQGDLQLQYELLKKKLQSEGLFNLETKKQIPANPKRIAVITALGGAALQDFLNVIKRRSNRYDILILPATVQGDKAPKELIQALKKAQTIQEIEVIVLTRGGGSLEDLWAFNDEKLVREIAASSIPVISAIGHQVDFTLCDYVSDLRLETPTAAAEYLSQGQKDYLTKLDNLGKQLKMSFQDLNHHFQRRLEAIKPKSLNRLLLEKLSNFNNRLLRSSFFDRLPQLAGIYNYEQELDQLHKALISKVNLKLESAQERNNHSMSLLSAYSPMNILKKGYTLVYDNTKLIKSAKAVNKVDGSLKIVFHDGEQNVQKI